MRFDSKRPAVFHIRQGWHEKWEVIDEQFEKPLAFFTKLEHAKKYAKKVAEIKKESRVMLDE